MIASVGSDDAKQGESIYTSKCIACHGAGIAGAPKLGDKAAWDARIAKGNAVLTRNAIEGFKGTTGYMPAKGGYMTLSDDEVSLAVQYMVSQVQ
jgi:cytochrome c5